MLRDTAFLRVSFDTARPSRECGSPFSLASRLQDAANDSEAIDRVHDLRFALDRVLASELGARLDSRRIVAAGHSYGANTSLIAAGATVVRNGSPIAPSP
jgi:predicted dienelactone hydrolase